MARARLLKPGFFQNEKLAALGPEAMVLFAGLWTIADREGRLEYRPERIKALLFPYWRRSVVRPMADLHQSGFISIYSVGSQQYVAIQSFCKHQSPHKLEPASTIPAPEKAVVDACDFRSHPSLTLNPIPETVTVTSAAPPAPLAFPSPRTRKATLFEKDAGWDDFQASFVPIANEIPAPEDWSEALTVWALFDPGQKSLVLGAIKARTDAGEVIWHSPQAYLRKGIWKREKNLAVQPRAGPKSKQLLIEDAFTAIERERHARNRPESRDV